MGPSGFFSVNMAIAVFCFTMGNILGWYSSNLQFVSEFWKEKVFLSILTFGIPSLAFYWFGSKHAMIAVPELWTVRFVGFTMSYLAFPIMTWYYMGESPFSIKNMICIFFALCIILTQFFLG